MAETLVRAREYPGVLMGAANVASAYRLYAELPGTSFKLLGYMALVSLDRDAEPWFGQGAEELSIRALGRPKADKAALRAVERAMTPLFEAGAITTVRHSSGREGRKFLARYRLWLIEPAPPEKRAVDNYTERAEHPQLSGGCTSYAPPGKWASTPRKVVQHPPESGSAPPENRGAKEYEEYEETKEERRTPNTALDLTDCGRQPAAGQDKNGISLADASGDPEARRRHAADALIAWELEQATRPDAHREAS